MAIQGDMSSVVMFYLPMMAKEGTWHANGRRRMDWHGSWFKVLCNHLWLDLSLLTLKANVAVDNQIQRGIISGNALLGKCRRMSCSSDTYGRGMQQICHYVRPFWMAWGSSMKINRWKHTVWYFGPIQSKETICAVNGKTVQGRALYAKAKAIFAAWEVQTQAVSAYVVVHGAPHLPVDLQSLQIELSLYSLCVEHLRKDCQFVLAKIEGFCGCRDSRKNISCKVFFLEQD